MPNLFFNFPKCSKTLNTLKLKNTLKHIVGRIDLLKKLAESLEIQAKYKEAITIWERIHKLDPMDSSARSKVTQLHAETVMDRGGYEDADSTENVKQPQQHRRRRVLG